MMIPSIHHKRCTGCSGELLRFTKDHSMNTARLANPTRNTISRPLILKPLSPD
jgi:hypothetical protein